MKIDYYRAGQNCLLIFTGLNGDTKGYENKYVKIAEKAVKDHNFSVAVAAVPGDCWDRPEEVFKEALTAVYAELSPKKLYIMGSSAGATIALWYAHNYPDVEKILAINPLLNFNYQRMQEGLEKFSGECAIIVSGEFDMSAMWHKLLPDKYNVERYIYAGVDHLFSGKVEEFVALSEVLFF